MNEMDDFAQSGSWCARSRRVPLPRRRWNRRFVVTSALMCRCCWMGRVDGEVVPQQIRQGFPKGLVGGIGAEPEQPVAAPLCMMAFKQSLRGPRCSTAAAVCVIEMYLFVR